MDERPVNEQRRGKEGKGERLRTKSKNNVQSVSLLEFHWPVLVGTMILRKNRILATA